jgi:hypothetical protein
LILLLKTISLKERYVMESTKTSTVKKMGPPPNPGDFKKLTSGIWNNDSTLNVRGGQSMWFKIKNINALGTTIRITDHTGMTEQAVIAPGSTVDIVFGIFGSEPIGWNFNIESISDAFSVSWELWSTWVG